MRGMARSRLPVAVALVLVAAGCGENDPPSPLCTQSSARIERALEQAPKAVRLSDATRLSDCVSHSRSDSELQELGLVFSSAAEHVLLRAQNDPRAALQLGYLVGAARRGAERTNGIHAELVRRLEQTAAALDDVSSATSAALERGLKAGHASG
jgi:hypothetical protein